MSAFRPLALAAALLAVTLALVAPAASDELEKCPGHEDDPREQVVGTDEDDVLTVPDGAIGCGLGGDDVLRADRHGGTRMFGGDGNDILCANNGDPDRLYGGVGNDRAKSDEEDTLRDIEGDQVFLACFRR